MWERGLKLTFDLNDATINVSLPMWERGLKLYSIFTSMFCISRSPCGSVD